MKKIITLLLITILSLTAVIACTPAEIPENDVPSTGADINVELPQETEKENQILGKEGNTKFIFTVIHADGSEVQYNVETTKSTLADALLEGSIIKGDEGEFGIYVTEIDGEKADFDKDGAYWYFYKDGEPLMEGISATPIAEGDSFEARYTK